MRQIYFSHSYRDRAINSYFLERFVNTDFDLLADQKSPTWCVAKLERYMLESSGFVSIVPRRMTGNTLGYSPYIGQELALARRAQVPGLFFVDDEVLNKHRADFPSDAIPFSYDDPGIFSKLHEVAIRDFKNKLKTPFFAPLSEKKRRRATIICSGNKTLLQAADAVGVILMSASYHVARLTGQRLTRAFDDIKVLEILRSSDICVFVLGDGLSYANVVLGMAYAHCIPSVRLRFDARSEDSSPDVNGWIRWPDIDHLFSAFETQFDDFNLAMREPVLMAKSTSTEQAIRTISTGQWSSTECDVWDPHDASGLIRHLSIEHPYVTDRVTRVRKQIGKGLGVDPSRAKSMEICQYLYDGLRTRTDFVYDYEPQLMLVGKQAIRQAKEFSVNNSATCIDLACLFASLLEAAHQRSVIIVIDGQNYRHAIVGYWVPDEPRDHAKIDLGLIRGSVNRGDLVILESTGVAYSDIHVAGETNEERMSCEGKLFFSDAKSAATRTLMDEKISLGLFIDVHNLRVDSSVASQ